MSIKTTCRGCGSIFAAPESLEGQAVKCPGCGQPVRVPSADSAASASAPGSSVPQAGTPQTSASPSRDLGNDVASFDMSLDALSPPSVGGSAAPRSQRGASKRSGAGRTGVFKNQGSSAGTAFGTSHGSSHGTAFDKPVGAAAGDDQFEDRMSRLYGVMTNKDIGRAKRGRFTIGFGVSIGIVVVVTVVGVLLAVQALRDGPTVVVDPNPTPREADPNVGPVEALTAVGAIRPPLVDPDIIWAPPTPVTAAPTLPESVAIETTWADLGRRHAFVVRLPGGVEEAQVVLYRSDAPGGTFAQVDRAIEPDTTTTAATVFQLNDTSFNKLEGNYAYYRVSGFDRQGRFLFDAPLLKHPIVAPPVVDRNRLTWQPHGSSSDVPPVAVRVYLDAPGWEEALIGRVDGAGPVNVALPVSPVRTPLRTVLATVMPTRLDLDETGQGKWQQRLVEHAIASVASDSAAPMPAGLLPVVEESGLSFRMLPSESAFTDVSQREETLPGQPVTASMAFRLDGDSSVQMLSAQGPPGIEQLLAMPFDRAVRLSWDNTMLLSHRERYADDIALGIYRQQGDGPSELIATLPVDATSYTDRDVRNGMNYTYAVEVNSAAAPGSAPLLKVDAWAAGVGQLAVMVKAAPMVRSSAVLPDPSLSRLHVALARPELAYEETDRVLIDATDQLARVLIADSGVTLIDRGALETALETGGTAKAPLPGSPAHVELRFVDEHRAEGDRLRLWATDLVTGQATDLGAIPITSDPAVLSAQSAGRVAAVRDYLAPRRRDREVGGLGYSDPPRRIVLGSILPADQLWMHFGFEALRDDLAAALRDRLTDRQIIVDGDTLATPTANGVLLIGRVWTDANHDPGLTVRAVSLTTGRVIDTFRVERVTPMTAGAFAVWAQGLELPAEAMPDTPSPLLAAEAALPAIHPVHLAMASTSRPSSFSGGLPLASPGAVTMSVGLPLPRRLGPYTEPSHRADEDPLATVRPYVAHQTPLLFEDWSAAYADYIAQDFEAFRQGIIEINGILRARQGSVMPRLYVRGEPIFTGSEPVNARGALPSTPLAIVTQPYLQAGASERPLINYRSDLSEAFQAQPYMMSMVWAQVPDELRDAFLRAELYGVENGRMKKLLDPKRPPPFQQYVAAALLGDMGHSVAEGWRRQAIKVSAYVLGKLEDDSSIALDSTGRRYAVDSLRILLYENDPGAIRAISNPGFRARFFEVPAGQEADALRLLTDRLGPAGWQWAGEQPRLAWEDFRWRDIDEMRRVSDGLADALPVTLQDHLDQWVAIRDTVGNPRSDNAATETSP